MEFRGVSEDISSRGLVCITLTGLAVGSASTIRDSLMGAGSSYTVEIFLMHELIMHKSDNASIFAVTELVPI